MSLQAILLLILNDALWSAVAATGFAVLFNVPLRTLWGCALAGATGHAIRTVLMETMGSPIEIATLAGATAVGFLGVNLARHLRAPALIFTVTGAIPMVPGLLAYSTMLGLIRLTIGGETDSSTLLVETAVDAVRAGLVLGAIALGIIMPKLLFHRVKPVV